MQARRARLRLLAAGLVMCAAGMLRLPGAAVGSAPGPRARALGLVCRPGLRRRPVLPGRGPGRAGGRGVPGLVVPPGGARVGVSHGAVQVAERSAGLEVQRGECVP